MPYGRFLDLAQKTHYDIDRLASAFSVSFEQACQRLTTLQRESARGVPFFFLRVDKAGNVTKRFNATSFNIAEHGGSCPVWNLHNTFRTPGVILPQFVELPDGEQFCTLAGQRRDRYTRSTPRTAASPSRSAAKSSTHENSSTHQLPGTAGGWFQQNRHQLPPVPAPELFTARP